MSRGLRKRTRRSGYGVQLSLNLPPGKARRWSPEKGRTRRLPISVRESMDRISPYLPSRSRDFVERILLESPTEVIPVEARESKHGDFMAVRGQPYGRITVNTCGNAYQFLLTLLHEVAHARVAARYRRRVPPHGAQWKLEFSEILLQLVEQDVLPRDLKKAFRSHALDPKSTADYDTELQLALRRYDTLDTRLLVMDLRDGEYFSLDGRRVLRKGELVRRRIRCVATDGDVYSVLPSARVQEIYPLKRKMNGKRRKQNGRR